MPDDRRTKMTKIYQQAHFLQIQKMEESGDLKTALKEYQIFTKENANSDLAEKAQWNMMQLHYKTADNFGGAQAALDFANRFPKSDQAMPALIRAAATFESMGQLEMAAKVLVKMADRMPDQRAKWTELAADYNAMSGHPDDARVVYQEMANSAKDEERSRLLAKTENFEKSYGTEKSHQNSVQQLVQKEIQPFVGDAKVAHLQSVFDEHDFQNAFQESKRLLGLSSLSPAQKSRVRLVQAQVLEDEFFKQSVKAKPERLGMVLALKTEKLSKAEQALQSVIRFGEPKTALQALEHLHKCFDHYVTALKSIPVPEGMTEAESASFKKELENLEIPLEEKGVEALAQAAAFAKKNQMYDGPADRLADESAAVNRQTQLVRHVALSEPSPVVPVEQWGAK